MSKSVLLTIAAWSAAAALLCLSPGTAHAQRADENAVAEAVLLDGEVAGELVELGRIGSRPVGLTKRQRRLQHQTPAEHGRAGVPLPPALCARRAQSPDSSAVIRALEEGMKT